MLLRIRQPETGAEGWVQIQKATLARLELQVLRPGLEPDRLPVLDTVLEVAEVQLQKAAAMPLPASTSEMLPKLRRLQEIRLQAPRLPRLHRQ
jgi:hypothetical protein